MKVGSVCTIYWDRSNFFISLLIENKDTGPSIDDGMMLRLSNFFSWRAISIIYILKLCVVYLNSWYYGNQFCYFNTEVVELGRKSFVI